MVIVQAALEPIAEDRAERLAGAHAVEQTEREADATGRQIYRQRPVLLAAMREVAGPQHRRPWPPDRARGVDVAVRQRLGERRWTDVLEHAVASETSALRPPARSAASRREACALNPGVEPVRGEVERSGREPRQHGRGQRGEMPDACLHVHQLADLRARPAMPARPGGANRVEMLRERLPGR